MSVEDVNDSDTSNDLMLAQMLQLQFDVEYEKDLKARENRMNGTSKGMVFNWESEVIVLIALIFIAIKIYPIFLL